VAVLCVLEGVRPKAPVFVATRGYTKGLWEMTTLCWKENPGDRPTVDHLLDVLRSAAEQWKPKDGALAALSPALMEKSDSGAQPDRDETVDRILDRAKSPLGEAEALEVIETLETVSRQRSPPTCRCIRLASNRCWNPTTK